MKMDRSHFEETSYQGFPTNITRLSFEWNPRGTRREGGGLGGGTSSENMRNWGSGGNK